MSRYFADPRKVVHETIDGEVILIQLDTGCYYSLGGSGAEIWGLLAGGQTPDEAAAALRVRFDAPPGVVEASVAQLAEQLRAEDLLQPDGDGPPPQAAAAEPGERGPFVEPVLEKYTDMQDFLLVDPIHDVAEAGWPHTRDGRG